MQIWYHYTFNIYLKLEAIVIKAHILVPRFLPYLIVSAHFD